MKAKFEKSIVMAVVLVIGLATSIADADLVAHWKFDDGTGVIAKDSAGNYDGILRGDPTWVASNYNGALEFDGKDDCVKVGAYPVFNPTGSFSISLWANITEWETTWGDVMIGNNCNDYQGWSLRHFGPWWGISKGYQQPADALCFTTTGIGHADDNIEVTPSETVPPLNKWIHIVCVYDSVNHKKYIYLNGVESTKEGGWNTNPSGKLSPAPQSLYIGARPNPSDTGPDCSYGGDPAGYFFKGRLDEVRFFNHALNKDEITQLFKLSSNSLTSEPMLPTLLEAVKEAEAILKEQKPKQAIAFLEKKIAEYEQWKQKDPNNTRLAPKGLSCDMYFLLAKAKEAAGAPKEEITSAYKYTVESDTLSSSRQGSALLWLFENTNSDEHDDIIETVIQNNSNYLEKVAAMAETMIREKKWHSAIRFLEGNLAVYERWQKKHPLIAEDTLPGIYFQLAKAKEAVDAPKKDVADAYSNTFKPSTFDYEPERVAALIWLVENQHRSECAKAIKLFTQGSDTRDCFKNAVARTCEHFESKKDWPKFQRFLDILFTEVKYPSDWAVFLESCFGDKTNRWAQAYYTYLNDKPRLKFGRDCIVAEQYLADGKFKEAAELYQDIVNRCGPDDDKRTFEFQLCKCLFNRGQYHEAVAHLENFITNNKATNTSLMKNAMLMKGHAHVQLGEIDKATDVFSTVTTEYPDTKEAPEAKFSLGYCYMLQGKFKQAKETLNLVLKDYPQSSFSNRAKLCLIRIKDMTEG